MTTTIIPPTYEAWLLRPAQIREHVVREMVTGTAKRLYRSGAELSMIEVLRDDPWKVRRGVKTSVTYHYTETGERIAYDPKSPSEDLRPFIWLAKVAIVQTQESTNLIVACAVEGRSGISLWRHPWIRRGRLELWDDLLTTLGRI